VEPKLNMSVMFAIVKLPNHTTTTVLNILSYSERYTLEFVLVLV